MCYIPRIHVRRYVRPIHPMQRSRLRGVAALPPRRGRRNRPAARAPPAATAPAHAPLIPQRCRLPPHGGRGGAASGAALGHGRARAGAAPRPGTPRGQAPLGGRAAPRAPRLALRASRSATVPLANERPGAGRLRSVRRPCARPTPRRSSRSSGRYLPCIPAMPPRGPRQAPTRPRAAPGIARLRVASCLLASSWRLGRHCATSSALLAATARPLEPFPSRSSL
jgi:hypothetical protein